MITKAIRSATRRRDDVGASAVEYGLLVALIAAVIVLAVFGLGMLIHTSFSTTCDTLKNPGPLVSSADCNA